MDINPNPPKPVRIATSPPGRGMRARPDVLVNNDYVRQLLETGRVTERDENTLRWLDELPVMSARQIKIINWADSSKSNVSRRLRALYDMHLLDRVRMLDKRNGIIYALGRAGRLWLHGETRGGSPARVNTRQIAHDLAVAEFVVQMVGIMRRNSADVSIAVDGEAGARITHNGAVVVEPDVKITIGSYTWLLEMDMGTESLPAFGHKIQRYHNAIKRGNLLLDAAGRWPLIVVVAPDQPRADALAALIAAQKSALPWALMTMTDIMTAGLFATECALVRAGKIDAMCILDASRAACKVAGL